MQTGKKKQILKRLLFLAVIAFMITAIWKLSVSGGTLAREQITKDGYFETDGYEVRGIRFYITPLTNDGIPESLDFTVTILDEAQHSVWQQDYKDMHIASGDTVILEEFERGEGIALPAGSYHIACSLLQDPSLSVRIKIMSYDGSCKRLYGGCAAAAIIFLVILLGITMKQDGKFRLPVCFFTAMVLMGILYSLIMPPLTVPDEESHFFKAYDLASDMLFQEKKDQYGNRLMRQTDVDSTTYLHSASSIYRWYDTFWDPVDVSEITSNIKWATVSDTTPAYSYLFSALGIALSRLCRVNGHLLLLFGRWFNLLGVAAIMAVALYLVPFGKKFFCVFGLLPEVIYLAASYSYDALNFALCFLAISYFFYMIHGGKQVKVGNLLIFLGVVLIMIPIKLVYAPLLGLVFLIPRKRLQINKWVIIGTGLAGVVGAVGLVVVRYQDIVVILKGLAYNTMEGERVSIKYMLENPRNALFVFSYNIMSNFDYYIKSILGEFVGRDRYEVLLDIAYLPDWLMMLTTGLLAMGIYTDGKNELTMGKKLWTALLAVISSFLFMLSMYLANNTVDMNAIHGIQGRYFLPVLLLLPAMAGCREENMTMRGSCRISRYGYLLLAAGIDIIAVFVQLQHIIMDYYG